MAKTADGKKSASGIDKYLGGSGVLNKGEEIELPVIPVGGVHEHGRLPTRTLAPCGHRSHHHLHPQGIVQRAFKVDRAPSNSPL